MSDLDGFFGWLTALGVVAALAALAWQSFRYVSEMKAARVAARKQQFLNLLFSVGNNETPATAKIACAYALREFPEHREFIARFLAGIDYSGSGTAGAAQLLKAELEATANWLAKK